MDPEISPRLSSRTHLAETCPECNGDGFRVGAHLPSGHFASEKCQPCGGSGRVVRFTHDPRSDNQSDDTDAEIDRLRAELGAAGAEVGRLQAENERLWRTPEAAIRRRTAPLLDAARKAKDALDRIDSARSLILTDDGREFYGTSCAAWPDFSAALSAISAVLGESLPTPSTVEGSPKLLSNSEARALAERVRALCFGATTAEPGLLEPSPEVRAIVEAHPVEAVQSAVDATKHGIGKRILALDLTPLLGGDHG